MRWCSRTDRQLSPRQFKVTRGNRLLPENEGWLLPLPWRIYAGQEAGNWGCQRLIQSCINRGREAEDYSSNQTRTSSELFSLLFRNSASTWRRMLAGKEGLWQRHLGAWNSRGGGIQRCSNYNAVVERQLDPMDKWSRGGSRWWKSTRPHVNKQKLKTVWVVSLCVVWNSFK